MKFLLNTFSRYQKQIQFSALIAVIHTLVFVIFCLKKVILADQYVAYGFLLLLSTFSGTFWFLLMVSLIPARWLRFLVTSFGLLFWAMLIVYKKVRGASLDFSLLYTNIQEFLSYDGIREIAVSLGQSEIVALALIVISFILLELKFKVISGPFTSLKKVASTLLIVSLFNGLVFLAFPKNHQEMFSFAWSAKRYFNDPFMSLVKHESDLEGKQYPYVYEHKDAIENTPPKHIILLMLESFSGLELFKYAPNGKEISPHLNALAKKGLYINHFYSASVQTARGHVASLCSLIPSFRQKIMTRYQDSGLNCLPKILSKQGYHTIAIKGDDSLIYDNEGEFLRKIGFDEVYGNDHNFVDASPPSKIWGWGPQDSELYRKTIAHADSIFKKDPDSKLFITLASISHHQPFNEVPKDQLKLYTDPQNFRERYLSSLHLADEYLGTFIEKLQAHPKFSKDTLLIVTGDHGFPTGRNKNTSNEMTYSDELFRIPLVMYWPGQIKSKALHDEAYTQLDIAPTILELTNINTLSHFNGRVIPIFEQSKVLPNNRSIMFQPYDGGYFISIKMPYKYVYSGSTGEQYVYNLLEDPDEKHNIIGQMQDSIILQSFRQDVIKISKNQVLIEEDRIFPKSHNSSGLSLNVQ
ncbi:MAG TPA: LTA synthase family protein [Oligoflexia bacterium]|nr:LTA synthase family protein [Oligoflexia bacterium]HMR24449.1 LTA synthase family protein [Oligoflexia bacterium]